MSEAAIGNEGLPKIEREYLRILSEANTGAMKGEVCVDLASAFHTHDPTNFTKIAEYCRQALEFPILPADQARMYLFWAEAGAASVALARGDDLEPARARAAEVYLKGLAAILGKTTNSGLQELPSVSKYRVVGPPDAVEAAEKKHTEELAKRERVVAANELVGYRRALIDGCAALYRNYPPRRFSELERLARRYLGGHDQVIKELLDVAKRSANE